MKKYTVAIVGALEAVGQEMINILEERNFPAETVIPMASADSVGKLVRFKGNDYAVEEAREGAFNGVDIALFSTGTGASRVLAPIAAREGCVVIDISDEWRMDPDVPLIVPEINPESLKEHKGIIASPGCSATQLLVALKPIHDLYKIRRIVVSTYQAVSDGRKEAVDELYNQVLQYANGEELTNFVFPYQILFNAIPQTDVFLDNGYTNEEMKLANEIRKVLDRSISASATTVRIPVFRGHSESVNVQTELPIDMEELREAMKAFRGLCLKDDMETPAYPLAIDAEATDDVFVGRLRRDDSAPNCVNMWVVADNLRKGSALNAVQIAETMIEMEIL